MAETLEFELVSPERLLVSEAVEMVVVPGVEGDFGALPHHAPLISAVRPGVIEIYKDGQVNARIFVAGGIAEVNDLRCTVLAEEAIPVAELDATKVGERRQAAEKALAEASGDFARHRAQAAVAVAEAMAEALGGRAAH